MLDGENLILIYEYIIAKCAVRDLFAHIQLCFEFSTPFLKQTKFGYCLTTINMAMTMLTEKSELITNNVEVQEEDAEEDNNYYQRNRAMSHSIHEVFHQQEDSPFQLSVPQNILQNKLNIASSQSNRGPQRSNSIDKKSRHTSSNLSAEALSLPASNP